MMVEKEQVLDAIRRMSVSDLVDLVRALEAEVRDSGGEAASDADERSSSGVLLREFTADKVAVIRAVREVTDLGLREARAVVEAGPPPDLADGNDEGIEGAGVPAVPKPPRPSGQAEAEASLH